MKRYHFNKTSFGFTLVELLIVVAIIAVLASILFALYSGAKSKTNDASIKSELASLKNQAAIYASSNNNSYDLMFATNNQWSSGNSNINSILVSINKKSTVHTAGSNPSAWAAQVRSVTDTTQYICLDSSLIFSTSTNAMTAGATSCP